MFITLAPSSALSFLLLKWLLSLFDVTAVLIFSIFVSRSNILWCCWKSILCCTRGFVQALWTRSRCMECRSYIIHFVKWDATFLGWYPSLTSYIYMILKDLSSRFQSHNIDIYFCILISYLQNLKKGSFSWFYKEN